MPKKKIRKYQVMATADVSMIVEAMSEEEAMEIASRKSRSEWEVDYIAPPDAAEEV